MIYAPIVQLQQLAPGLWRWTARHPEWERSKEQDSPADVAILTTLQWHRRSRDELAKRYDASTSRARRMLLQGVESIVIRGAGETMFWIPEHGALVPGDRILGDRPPGLRMCPPSWPRYLKGFTQDDLREALRPLLELPIEMVLVSHGEPVLRDARKELERALAA